VIAGDERRLTEARARLQVINDRLRRLLSSLPILAEKASDGVAFARDKVNRRNFVVSGAIVVGTILRMSGDFYRDNDITVGDMLATLGRGVTSGGFGGAKLAQRKEIRPECGLNAFSKAEQMVDDFQMAFNALYAYWPMLNGANLPVPGSSLKVLRYN